MTKKGYKKHKKVIDWFYMQESTTCVLTKDKENNKWIKTNCPTFSEDEEYLINDEYVDFRNAIYMGRTLELKEAQTNEWIPVLINDPNEKFEYHSDMYRVEEDTYPIYKKNDFMVVKFTNEIKREVVFVFNRDKALFNAKVESYRVLRIEIKDIDDGQWEDVLYNREKGLWDGQPVWCYDKDYETIKSLGFYDAKHNRLFDVIGSRCGNIYDNYKPYPHLTDDWVIEAYNRLEF